MKYPILIYFLILFTGTSFNINQDKDLLAHVNHLNTLTLTFRDDKCGEWGGDKETILLYREDFRGDIYADYKKEIINCDDPHSEDKIERKDKIRVSESDKKLIIDSIKQLTEGILSRENYPAHSGYHSEVIMKDSSVVLSDFPSIRWTKFEELSKKLTVANHKK